MGGGGQNTVQTTTQEMSPEQRALLEPVIPIAKDFLANPPQQYPGTGIAPFTPLQQQGQQMTVQAAQQMLPYMQMLPQQLQQIMGGFGQNANAIGAQSGAANNQLQQIMGATAQQAQSPGMNFLTSGATLDPNSNMALQAATQAAIRPFIENFQTNVMPGIASEAVSAGGFGGTRQGIAEGLASRALLQQTGDITANMANSAYTQGLQALIQGQGLQQNALGALMQGNIQGQQAQQGAAGLQQQGLQGMLGALGQSGNIMQQGLLPAQLVSAVGEQQQGMGQAQLSEQIQKYVSQQMIPFAAAQDVAGLAFGMPGGSSTSNAQTSGGGGGIMPFLQAGAGIMTALPALFSLFSDRKLKTEIEKVGELPDGLGVYNYKLFDKRHVGLMSDEVKKLYPLAVKLGTDGFERVMYHLVPSWTGDTRWYFR